MIEQQKVINTRIVLTCMLCLFLTLKLILNSVPQLINNLLYILVLLPALLIGIKKGFSKEDGQLFFIFYILLTIFSLLSIYTDGINDGRILRTAKHTLYLFAYTLLLRHIYCYQRQLAWCIWLSALAITTYSGYTLYLERPFQIERVVSASAIGSAPMLADLIGCFGLFLCVNMIREKKYIVSFLITIIAIIAILSLQGRAIILGLSLAGLFWLFYEPIDKKTKIKLTLSIIALASIINFGFFIFFNYNIVSEMLTRGGGDIRLEMWKDLSARVEDCGYWLGCGYYADPESNILMNDRSLYHNFYHNLFLSQYFYMGLSSSLIFFIFISTGLYRGLKSKSSWAYVLVAALVCYMYEGDKIFNNPDLVWLLFWIPILYCYLSNTTPPQQLSLDNQKNLNQK